MNLDACMHGVRHGSVLRESYWTHHNVAIVAPTPLSDACIVQQLNGFTVLLVHCGRSWYCTREFSYMSEFTSDDAHSSYK